MMPIETQGGVHSINEPDEAGASDEASRVILVLGGKSGSVDRPQRDMKSVIELEINARRADVAELFADPRRNLEWMDDVARIEAVSGVLGDPGSSYRLVPKRGNLIFVATVVARKLPDELKLSLDSPMVSVAVEGRLLALSDRKTKLISEEHVTFKGAIGKILGFLARGAIKRAHRRHMEAFKRFVESHVAAQQSAPADAR